MAKTKTSPETEKKVIAAIEAGLTISDIAKRFGMTDRTVYRIKDRINKPLAPMSDCQKITKPVKVNESDVIRGQQAELKKKEIKVASVALSKALSLFESIDPEKMPEGQKAMSGGILLDKYRLITGQANNITEHREIQVTALRLLDERKKAAKNIIDVKPVVSSIESAPPQNPIEQDDATHTGNSDPKALLENTDRLRKFT